MSAAPASPAFSSGSVNDIKGGDIDMDLLTVDVDAAWLFRAAGA